MKRHWHMWVLVSTVLLVLVAACRGDEGIETAVCNFKDQTAVTVNIHNEKGEPQ